MKKREIVISIDDNEERLITQDMDAFRQELVTMLACYDIKITKIEVKDVETERSPSNG